MTNKVTKKELAEILADKYGYTKKEANEVVTTIFDEIAANLAAGNEIDISGFGKFYVKERKEREGINPATGQKITISSSRVPAFKAKKALKEAVENNQFKQMKRHQ